MTRVYLDNCCYNRPFDDQGNLIVHLETQAKLAIQQMIKNNELELVWSDVLTYENNRNPFIERATNIAKWAEIATTCVHIDDEVVARGKQLLCTGLKNMDALHVASSIKAQADFFITVDKGILKRKINDIKIVTPYTFLDGGIK